MAKVVTPPEQRAALLARIRQRLEVLKIKKSRASKLAGLDTGYITDLERKPKEPTLGPLLALAQALEVDLGWLVYGEEAPAMTPAARTVPLDLVIGWTLGEPHRKPGRLREPYAQVPAPRSIRNLTGLAAAEVADRSCDGLRYPPGTLLFYRRLTQLDAPLLLHDRVIVELRDSGAFLCGLLDRNTAGDLQLSTRSSDETLPRNLDIQPAAGSNQTLSDAGAPFLMVGEGPREIDYELRPDDRTAILGVVRTQRRPPSPAEG